MVRTLKAKIFIASTSAFLIMLGIVVVVLFQFSSRQSEMLGDLERSTNDNINRFLEEEMNKIFTSSLMGAKTIAANPEIQELFSQRDREGLLRVCLPIYEEVKDQGISQFQFHTPDNRSFLRLHMPEKYGDDLSSFRKTVVMANSTKREVVGFEEGRAGFGFRAVVPVSYQGRHVGTVEYGGDFGEDFVQELKQKLGMEAYIYKVDEKGTGELLVGTAEDKVNLPADFIEESLKKGEYKGANLGGYRVIIFPFKDYAGEIKGYVKLTAPQKSGVLAAKGDFRKVLIISILTVLMGMLLINSIVLKGLAPLGTVAARIREVKLKGFSKFEGEDRPDEIGEAIGALKELVHSINSALEGIQERNMGIVDTLRGLREKLSISEKAVVEVLETNENFSNLFSGVVETTRDASRAVSEIAKGTEEIALSIQEISSESTETSRYAEETNSRAMVVGRKIQDVMQATKQAVDTVGAMEEASKEIMEILNIIEELADQTNLLALNAAIEAARAGEQGRGFAVVADEIRKLAENTKSSTSTISQLLMRIKKNTEDTIGSIRNIDEATLQSADLIDAMLKDITAISQRIYQINGRIESIAAATQEQTAASEEAAASMTEIEKTSLHALEALEGIRAHMQDLSSFVRDTEEAMTKVEKASMRWSYYELRKNFEHRRAEHEKWVAQVRNLKPVQFDPTKCNFGRFYYSYKPEEGKLREIYSRFEEPHRLLHRSGQRAVELAGVGKMAEANKALKEMEVHYGEMYRLFEEFFSELEKLFLKGTLMF